MATTDQKARAVAAKQKKFDTAKARYDAAVTARDEAIKAVTELAPKVQYAQAALDYAKIMPVSDGPVEAPSDPEQNGNPLFTPQVEPEDALL